MTQFKASRRPTYTYQEISGLLKEKLNEKNKTIEDLQKMYPDISLEKMGNMLNGNKNYSIPMLKIASHFLNIPFGELTKVIEDKPLASLRTKENINEEILSFYELVSDLFDEMIFQSKLRNKKETVSSSATASLIKSQTNLCNEQIAWQSYVNFLKQYNLSNKNIYDIAEIVKICSATNRKIIYFMFPNNLKISGICLKKEDRIQSYDCIYLNSSENKERRKYSFFHELYHAYFEPSNFLVDDDSVMYDNKNDIEKRANLFASFMIFPMEAFVKECVNLGLINKKVCMNEVIQLQTKFHSSFSATVYFLNKLTKILKILFPEQNLNWNLTIDESLFKYNSPNYWAELEQKTKEYNTYLDLNKNQGTKDYYFPDDFKNNLIENYKNGIITKDDVETIFTIFNEKGEY